MTAKIKSHSHSVFRHLLLSLLLSLTFPAQALDEINSTFFGNVAIEGYDPVAYFTENRPVKGNAKFEFEWKNATWRFSSAENLDLFQNDPERYAPQYGGYCAYAVSQNDTAGIDPDQFTIVNGKLYLNYSKKINRKWLKDRDAYIEAADRYWPDLLKK